MEYYYIYYQEVYMCRKFQDLNQFNFDLLRVKMSYTISLLHVLGLSAGWCNPIDLGVGPQGIPPDFTISKVEERIHFRGEGKILKGWECYGVVCVS